jgi:hypothetical protein
VTDYMKDGNNVTLTTAEQTADRKYIVGVLQRITGEDGSYIDGSSPQKEFMGKGSEEQVQESSSSSEESSAPSSVTPTPTYGRNPNLPNPNGSQNFLDLLRNRGQASLVNPGQRPVTQGRDTVPPENPSSLRLQPVLRPDGTYTVTAEWRGSPDTARDLNGYAVATSRDGYTFAPNATTDADNTTVRYTRVQPGTFGVRVSAIDTSGNRSSGVDKVITLPQSGLGLVGIALASGAAAAHNMRRKRKA